MSEPGGFVGPASSRSSRAGTGRIEAIFAELRGAGRRGLMPFVCGGYPTLEASVGAMPAFERAGACICEVGIPFSDPIADGPVIAGAMHKALEAGVTPASVFEAVARVRSQTEVGLVAMVSVSLVQRAGVARFVGEAKDAGFDGFIFPDAPLEEAGTLVEAAAEAGMSAALLIAPSTPDERAAEIARACRGFVYLLARAGITGEQGGGPGSIARRVEVLQGASDIPIACGFGIGSAAHVRSVVAHADAAIVGSALVKRMGEAAGAGNDAAQAGAELVGELAEGLVL